MRRALVGLAAGLALSVATALPEARGQVPDFDADEVARILRHGPWPPPDRADPTNRVSGNPGAIALGRRLFFDPRLSGNGAIACASCHVPERDFTDGRSRALGLGRHDRNTQGLLNAGLQRWFGWDGGADSLWSAALRPLLSPVEMGSTPARIAAQVRSDPALAARHAAVFGAAKADDDAVMVDVAKAIAAWVETLRSPRTAFDDFRDALARGDATGTARYPEAARRGLKIFIGRGNCSACHFGPAFSNGEFHDVGMPFVVEPGRVDPGRHAGIRRVRSDRFNLLGPWNDEPQQARSSEARALQTRTVSLQHRNWGEWRTPTLRGLGRTAPYMHDGRMTTLRDVVKHYSEIDEDRLHADGESLLKPLRLSAGEIDDLLVFLASLDAGAAPAR